MGENTSSMQADVIQKGEEVEATRADVKDVKMESGLPTNFGMAAERDCLPNVVQIDTPPQASSLVTKYHSYLIIALIGKGDR